MEHAGEVERPDHNETEAYLTPSQAAGLLQVSPKTVNRWAAAGRVPCIVTLGGHRRFSKKAILALAEQMAERGATPPS